MTKKYLNQSVIKYEKELGFWKNYMENIKTFNSEYKMSVISEYEAENRIARMETKLDIMRTFASLSNGELSIEFSKYFAVQCDERGARFSLTGEIESEVYDYVYNSHSELFVLVNKKLISFLAPVVNNRSWFGIGDNFDLECAMNRFNWIDEKSAYDLLKKDKCDFKSEIRTLVKKLQSDEIKPYIELAEEYVDLLVEKGKKEEEEGQ